MKYLPFALASLASIGAIAVYFITSSLQTPAIPSLPSIPTLPSEIPSHPSLPLTADGKVDKTKLDANGPWTRNLLLYESTDGKTWKERGIFVASAGVPSITKQEDGTLIAAIQWFPDDPAAFDKVAITTSADNGETWSTPISATFHNIPTGYQRPFDPTVVTTPEGNIRMYFTSSPGKKAQGNNLAIYSALSSDDFVYSFEEDARLKTEDVAHYDSAATFFNNTWYLTTPRNAPGTQGIHLATSVDGRTFTTKEGVTEKGSYNWTGNLVVMDNFLTFFGSSPESIWYAQSNNGTTWSEKQPINLPGGDPAVVQTNAGHWLMIAVE